MSYLCCVIFVFFKQKTAYEMRISDWSSDVCSSDLHAHLEGPVGRADGGDEVLALCRHRVHGGHDAQVGAAAGSGAVEVEVPALASWEHLVAGGAAQLGQALAAVGAGGGVDAGHAGQAGAEIGRAHV